jgi:dynein heavy chain
LKDQIQLIKDTWGKINFTVNYEEKCESFVIAELEDIYTELDNSLANLNMILGSRFVAPLRVEAELQKNYINTLSDMIDQWVICQKNWRYLENIFKASDIKQALPKATTDFVGVDKYFKNLMQRTAKNSKCINIVK